MPPNRRIFRKLQNKLVSFIKIEFSRIGADTSITPREVIRDFIELLDIIYQNPDADPEKLMSSGGFSFAKPEEKGEVTEQFAEFEI